MLKSGKKVNIRKLLLLKNVGNVSFRHSSSSSGGGSGIAFKLVLGTTAAVGGTLAYAKYDSSFRHTLKDNVPYIGVVLDAIGATDEAPKSGTAAVKDSPPSLLRKKETLKEQPKSPAKDESNANVVLPPVPTPPSSARPTSTVVPSSSSEKERERENFLYEQLLEDTRKLAERLSDEACIALRKSQEISQDYASKIRRAFDEARGAEDKFMWDEAQKVKVAMEKAKLAADAKLNSAKEAFNKLEGTIAKGLSKESLQKNSSISSAEGALHKLREKIDTTVKECSLAEHSVQMANAFKESVEKGREVFRAELQALLPEGKVLGDKSGNLTEADLNVLLAHAHKRVESLIRELSRYEASEDDRSAEFHKQLKQLDEELNRQRRDIEATIQQRLAKQSEEFEEELQTQLRRQVGVHTEHLREALRDQEEDLKRQNRIQIEQVIAQERAKQATYLANSIAKLENMEAHLIARSKLDELSRQAKVVWLSSAALKEVLTSGNRAPKGRPQPLGADIVPLNEAVQLNPLIKVVLETIPEDALKRGVYTESTLKERFHNVERACRRVAMIDHNGGSLMKYALSYLQSLFIVYPKVVPSEELNNEQKVNPEMWDTFDILTRVRAAIQREDLEQALRYANQLRGEPRNIASDWIKELRLFLETRQAANVLMSLATATVAQDASAAPSS